MCAQPSKQSITIKKYANRRLYNTATSTYVTLEDLCAMVKDGETFNVYDAKTSEDITRSVLTQIIVEEENKTGQTNLLPINFLRQLIGFYGDNNMQWMVPKYLEHSMEMLTGNLDQIRDYYKNAFGGMFPFGSTLEEMGKQNMTMFENTLRMFTPFPMTSMIPGFGTQEEGPTTATTTTTTSTAAKSCCGTQGSCATKPNACTTTGESSKSTSSKKETTVEKPIQAASVTSIKSRTETASNSTTTTPASGTTTTTTPMPNVANATSSTSSGADDMQQKIANLQRQLADLAKSRA